MATGDVRDDDLVQFSREHRRVSQRKHHLERVRLVVEIRMVERDRYALAHAGDGVVSGATQILGAECPMALRMRRTRYPIVGVGFFGAL